MKTSYYRVNKGSELETSLLTLNAKVIAGGKAAMKLAKELGAKALTKQGGRYTGALFTEPPDEKLWKKTKYTCEYHKKDYPVYMPRRTSKAAKALGERIASIITADAGDVAAFVGCVPVSWYQGGLRFAQIGMCVSEGSVYLEIPEELNHTSEEYLTRISDIEWEKHSKE